jgi:hypothetical protein
VAERFGVGGGVLGVGVDRVAVAAEGPDADVFVLEFLLPRFGLTRVGE